MRLNPAGPRVSIVVCARNAEDDLVECLESLAAQDYRDIEIVVVNDASNDATGDLARRFQERAARDVILISNLANLGVAGSRNVGIGRAGGEITAFTDADCVAAPDWISELVKGYDFGEASAVGGSISDPPRLNYWQLADKSSNFVARAEGPVGYIQGCNMSFDSAVLKKHMFNAEIKYGYEEALLCDSLVEEGARIYFRPQAVVLHKHRSAPAGLLKQKYLRGLSSIWYRKTRKKFPIFKRHLALLLAVLALVFSPWSRLSVLISAVLFLALCLSLVSDEIRYRRKSAAEILITFPAVLFLEAAHFAGSMAGLVRFWVLPMISFGRRPAF